MAITLALGSSIYTNQLYNEHQDLVDENKQLVKDMESSTNREEYDALLTEHESNLDKQKELKTKMGPPQIVAVTAIVWEAYLLFSSPKNDYANRSLSQTGLAIALRHTQKSPVIYAGYQWKW